MSHYSFFTEDSVKHVMHSRRLLLAGKVMRKNIVLADGKTVWVVTLVPTKKKVTK